jgi:hypothetical protein|tara:strand:+ start:717 stop:2189 length:1473 start_codon:yes stop_codon:yes gene_type:complete
MPNPVGINSYVTNFFSPSNLYSGVAHSINNIGGYQEFATIAERNAIPLKPSGASTYDGFTSSDDKWSSGRRRVGMMAFVIETQKLYTLQPVGYFNNGGALTEVEWDAAPEWERAVRIDPANSYTTEGPNFENGFTTVSGDASTLGISNDPNGCWVELVMGIDGNPISGLDYTEATGSLKITLTHDGSGTGTPIEFEVFVDNYTSALADTSTNVPTAVGGFNTVDTVAGLNGLTQNQMWDKLLFPTVNPVGSGVSVTLNDPYNLEEAQSVITMSLTTSASDGTLSNPSGPWSGNINAAIIDDISAGGATIAQQVLTVSAPDTISNLSYPNYSVVLGENKFRLTGSFDQGPMPQDSTGADYPGAQFPAGDKTNTTAFEGVWPIYLGTSADGFVKRGLVGQSANNIPCVQNYGENSGTGLWHRIAIPQAMVQGGDITIQLDAGQLGFQASYPGSAWVRTSVTFDVHVDALAVPYYLYTKGNPQGGANTWIINW